MQLHAPSHTWQADAVLTHTHANPLPPRLYLQQGWHRSDVVKQDTVEGAIDAIVEVVHERLSLLFLPLCPLTDHAHRQSVGGAGKVPTLGEVEGGGEELVIARSVMCRFPVVGAKPYQQ